MFSEFIGFAKNLLTDFFQLLQALPREYEYLLVGSIVLLVGVACKRAVTQ